MVRLITILSLAALVLGGCATTEVSRVGEKSNVELTDRWNDIDSRHVADAMIKDMLSFPWYIEFSGGSEEQKPTIIIQRIANKSHEHIPVDTFVNDIKRALLRSGRADFVVAGEERERIRDELKSQDVYASDESRKAIGEEEGADFALSGSINSTVDQLKGTRVTFYQVDLKLIDLESTREVWNGQKKIKKVMERSRYGW